MRDCPSHKLRLIAAPIATTSVSANDPGTPSDSFVIAARAHGFLPAAFDVAEVAAFNSSLPDFQITALKQYTRRRYKLGY